MSLLAGVLTLHDPSCQGRCRKGCVRDVESFCGEALERRGIALGHSDYEDRLAFAISECWILAGKYEPAKDGVRKNMAAWIFFRLGQRLVDAERAQFRTTWRFKDYVYERPRPELISYEHQLQRDRESAPSSHGDEYGELGRVVAAWSSDPSRDRDPDLGRILAARSGQFARDLDELGIEAPRRVA